MRYLPLLLALAGCAQTSEAPQGRFLTGGTTPLCLLFCTVVVTNAEAAQFPELRRAGEVTGNSKTTTSTSSVTNP